MHKSGKSLFSYFDGLPVTSNLNGFPYVFFPLTDYRPAPQPSLFTQLARRITQKVNFSRTQVLVGQADRGSGPLIYAVASKLKLPFALANWYPRETQSQILVENAHHLCGPGFIYLNGVGLLQTVSIVVDLISTGGTTLALAKAVLKTGAKIDKIVAAAENTDLGGANIISKTLKISPISIVKYRIVNNRTQVVDL